MNIYLKMIILINMEAYLRHRRKKIMLDKSNYDIISHNDDILGHIYEIKVKIMT